MKDDPQTTIVVVGNEKGGSGKSTTAIHLAVALLRMGYAVATVDADVRQRTLTQFLTNRRNHAERTGRDLPMPSHGAFARDLNPLESRVEEVAAGTVNALAAEHRVVVVDTPGADGFLTRALHGLADILVTPLNDSFIDLSVFARLDEADLNNGRDAAIDDRAVGPYARVVAEARRRRAAFDDGTIDWIITRTRLNPLGTRNQRRMECALAALGERLSFRCAGGFVERVIYKELFVDGLTLMNLGEPAGGSRLTMSHVVARDEVRALVGALRLRG